MNQVKLLDNLINDKNKFYNELEKVIIGQKEVIDYIFIAFLCRGHVLLEGVPGLGKTLLIKTLLAISSRFFPIYWFFLRCNNFFFL